MTSFGAKLKQQREQRGVSLDDISRSTKIGTRLLRALEDEHLDQLPGGIFNKGFIRAYARFLNMDEEEVIAEYLAATGGALPGKPFADPEAAPVLEPPPQAPGRGAETLPWGALAIALLLVAVSFALWGVYSRESQKPAHHPANTAAKPSGETSTTVLKDQPPEQKPPESASQSVPATSRASTEAAPSAAASGTASPSPSETAANPSIPGKGPDQSAASSGSLHVVIKARQDSWISITVDGEVTTQGTIVAPAQKSVRAEKEIVVKAGNVGALDFEFNGKKMPLQGGMGEVKTLTFDAKGLQLPPPTPETPAQSP